VYVSRNVDEYPTDGGRHILVGVSRITKEEASHLTNHTTRLPGDEDHYVVQLDVFHQLHCLVRQIISFKPRLMMLIVFRRTYYARPSILNTIQKPTDSMDNIGATALKASDNRWCAPRTSRLSSGSGLTECRRSALWAISSTPAGITINSWSGA